MKDYLDIGRENWVIIFVFIVITLFIMKGLPNRGLEWLSFVICALIIGISNSIALSNKSENFSETSKKFLIYRICWSLSFSLYVILFEINIFPNFGIYVVILFYCLAIFDIFLNIFNHVITTEVGPGFMPKDFF